MPESIISIFRLVACTALLAAAASRACADGGVARALQQDGGLQIAVFTSPAYLTAGEVDVSVLVQDAETSANLPDAQVTVEVVPRDRPYAAQQAPAAQDLATNKLLRACHLTLERGWHDVRVEVHDSSRQGVVAFAMQVGAEPTKAASFWPWFTWPASPILLMAAD